MNPLYFNVTTTQHNLPSFNRQCRPDRWLRLLIILFTGNHFSKITETP